MSSLRKSGRVFLAGAGPGDPDLITLRGAELIRTADVIIYDNLVAYAALQLARDDAELIFAGKKGGAAGNVPQPEINRLLIEHAQRGRRVVRLKGGDPFIFGRGGEEAEALRAAGIEYEIVPGVTSAIAVPAFAGIPLTHRDHGSFVTILTGHLDPAKDVEAAIPWTGLAQAAEGRGTLVILMGTAQLRDNLDHLINRGMPPTTPAAAIQWGTTASQRSVAGTLANLAAKATQAGLGAPAVIVVGECAALGDQLGWYERMPLFGRRIIVTRAAGEAPGLIERLRSLGAEAIGVPVIATAPPSSYALLDRAIAGLGSFDWIIFTSAKGVEAFMQRLRTLRRDIRELGNAAIAAIGPATAARVANYALTVAAMPTEYRAERLIDALTPQRIKGVRILIPRAETAREVLPEMLRAAGASEVVVAPAYSTIRPKAKASDHLRSLLDAAPIDLVTFTSPSTVKNWIELAGSAGKKFKAAVIGPITAEAARAHGLDVAVEALTYTVDGLVAAIEKHYIDGKMNAPVPKSGLPQ
ncbi:MAG TPA: uroporphyrinogen-III C-methyltransferase [Candidatus Binataceae bacterium]|nr:uroporphyrinogen-III C-methyltransferase [Candidatus Binataceae bacterium]